MITSCYEFVPRIIEFSVDLLLLRAYAEQDATGEEACALGLFQTAASARRMIEEVHVHTELRY